MWTNQPARLQGMFSENLAFSRITEVNTAKDFTGIPNLKILADGSS